MLGFKLVFPRPRFTASLLPFGIFGRAQHVRNPTQSIQGPTKSPRCTVQATACCLRLALTSGTDTVTSLKAVPCFVPQVILQRMFCKGCCANDWQFPSEFGGGSNPICKSMLVRRIAPYSFAAFIEFTVSAMIQAIGSLNRGIMTNWRKPCRYIASEHSRSSPLIILEIVLYVGWSINKSCGHFQIIIVLYCSIFCWAQSHMGQCQKQTLNPDITHLSSLNKYGSLFFCFAQAAAAAECSIQLLAICLAE